MIEKKESKILEFHNINFVTAGISGNIQKRFNYKFGNFGMQLRMSINHWKNVETIPFQFLSSKNLKGWIFLGVDLKGNYSYNLNQNLTVQLEGGVEVRSTTNNFDIYMSPSLNVKISSKFMKKY